jgi:hypothetical protein
MHMATQVLTRKQRGNRIAPEDIVELNPSSFFVKSQTSHSGYSVTRVGQDWTCDCPDYKFHHAECKHIFAVEAQIEEQTLMSRFKLNLWEASR